MPPDSSSHASEFRRTLSEATGRVEAIIDEAEETAARIRADAQREADAYLGQRKREVDAEMTQRARKLEGLTQPLIDRVEGLRGQASALSGEIDGTLARLRDHTTPTGSPAQASLRTNPAPVAPEPPAPAAVPEPELVAPEPAAVLDASWTDTVPGLLPPKDEVDLAEPAPEPAAGLAGKIPSPADPGPTPVAYPGTADPAPEEPAAAADTPASSEDALLRATQLAVSGSSRSDIEATLRSEFELDDVDAVLDGILGPEDR